MIAIYVFICFSYFTATEAILYRPGEPFCKYLGICTKLKGTASISPKSNTNDFDKLAVNSNSIDSELVPKTQPIFTHLSQYISNVLLSLRKSSFSTEHSSQPSLSITKFAVKQVDSIGKQPVMGLEDNCEVLTLDENNVPVKPSAYPSFESENIRYQASLIQQQDKNLFYLYGLAALILLVLVMSLMVMGAIITRLGRLGFPYLRIGFTVARLTSGSYIKALRAAVKSDLAVQQFSIYATYSRLEKPKRLSRVSDEKAAIAKPVPEIPVSEDPSKIDAAHPPETDNYIPDAALCTRDDINSNLIIKNFRMRQVSSSSFASSASCSRSESSRSSSVSSMESYQSYSFDKSFKLDVPSMDEIQSIQNRVNGIRSMFVSSKEEKSYYFAKRVPPEPLTDIEASISPILSSLNSFSRTFFPLDIDNTDKELDLDLCFLDLTAFQRYSAPLLKLESVMLETKLADQDSVFQFLFFYKLKDLVSGQILRAYWENYGNAFTQVESRIALAKQQLERCLQVVPDPEKQTEYILLLKEIQRLDGAESSSVSYNELKESVGKLRAASTVEEPLTHGPEPDSYDSASSFAKCGKSLVSDVFSSRWALLLDYEKQWSNCSALFEIEGNENMFHPFRLNDNDCEQLMSLSKGLDLLASRGAANVRLTLDMMKASRAAWFDTAAETHRYMINIKPLYDIYHLYPLQNVENELAVWKYRMERVSTAKDVSIELQSL